MDNRFDALAASWDVAQVHIDRTRDIADAMRGLVPLEGLNALEVGAGTALLSFALRDALRSVVATDPSQGMVDVIEDKIRQHGCSNMRSARCGDDLSCVGSPFDLVMLQMALHHVPDVPAFLRRAHGKLRAGGILAIADLDSEDGSFHGPDVKDVHLGFDRAELSTRLSEAGFEVFAFETAHTMVRERDGKRREYPVFLALARRAS